MSQAPETLRPIGDKTPTKLSQRARGGAWAETAIANTWVLGIGAFRGRERGGRPSASRHRRSAPYCI